MFEADTVWKYSMSDRLKFGPGAAAELPYEIMSRDCESVLIITNNGVRDAGIIDDVVEFDELAGDLSAVFPVTEGALRLLGHARDTLAGDGPDGFRERALVERRADGTLANKVKGWHRLAQVNGEDITQRTVRNWVSELEAVGLVTPEKYEQHAGVSYAADSATSKRALQVLSYNGGFEVAALRRFAEKVRGSDGALDWLAWAESVFDLRGDRCGWDPPPGSPG